MKHTIYVLTIIGLLFGCKKTEYIAKFDEEPQVRIQKEIQQLKASLTESTNGWIGVMPTLTGGGYGFYITFANDESLMMQADLDTNKALTANKSMYRIKQDMGVNLLFDTYNYISLLNDPAPGAFGGAIRDGYKSDIEFVIDYMRGDTIGLIGKRYRQSFTLVKASAAQKAKYDGGEYKTLMKSIYRFFIDNPNAYVDVNSLKAGVIVNSSNNLNAGKRVELSSLQTDGTVTAAKQKFAYTIDGVSVLEGGVNLLGVNFTKIAWKDATQLAMYDSKGQEYIIKNNPTPLLPLYKLWGSKYSGMLSDFRTIYPGTSTAGRDTLNYFHENMTNAFNDFPFNYARLNFVWNTLNSRLTINGFSSQNGGGSGWTTSGSFNYTVDANGVYTFTVQAPMTGGYVSKSMAKIWNFFKNNQVAFDYHVDGANVYAKVSSVNDPTTVMTFVLQ
jgi:hypothetical protein